MQARFRIAGSSIKKCSNDEEKDSIHCCKQADTKDNNKLLRDAYFKQADAQQIKKKKYYNAPI